MICKNIKHSIFLSVLFFVGSAQGGYAQDAPDMEAVPEMQTASFIPPLISLSFSPVISVRYAPTIFMADWTSRPAGLLVSRCVLWQTDISHASV